MGKVIKNKIQGMNWWMKTGLVLFLTLATTIVLYQSRLSAAPTANGRLVHSNSATTPLDKAYTVGTNTFAAGATMQTGAAQTFIVDRAAPTRNEHITGYVTTGGVLYIQRWNGTTWSAEWNVTVGGAGVNGRRFDIAYEKTTGDCMVAYSGNAANGSFAWRKWNGTSWTTAATVQSARMTTATLNRIILVPSPVAGSNNLAIAFANDAATSAVISAMLWNGSAWGTEIATASTATNPTTTGGDVSNYDIAYESSSGDILVVASVGSNNIQYATYTGGAWSTGAWAINPSFGVRNGMIKLSSAPSSNDILLMASRSAVGALPNVYAMTWSGTAWGTATTTATMSANYAINTAPISGGWLQNGANAVAVVVYSAATANTINYIYWNGTAWSAAQTGTVTTNATTKPWMDVSVDPGTTDTMMVTWSDSASDLWAKRLVYGGGTTFTWTNADAGTPLTATLASITTRNFSFGYNNQFTSAPTLTTPTATSIASTTATLGATITGNGGATITDSGIVWNTSTAPTTANNKVATSPLVTSNTAFTVPVTGLPAGTRIYYRGYATNSVGTSYSATEGSFYTEPVTQASGVNFTAVSQTGMNVNWTRGSGDGVIVLMKSASAVNSDPLDGTYTGYTANAAFVSGTQIGTGNYVIYKGTGTSVPVTALANSTTYHVAVYEYKGAVDTAGFDQGTNYDTPAAIANQATTAPCAAGTPTGLTVGTETTSTVPLTWAGAGTTNYYRIYRNGVQVSTNGSPTTGAYTDSTVTSGATYPFTVSGYNTAGACESAQTAAVNAFVLPAVPAAPTVSNPGTGNTLIVAIGADTNDSVVQYAIRINGGAYTNQYVQAGGNVGAGIVWQTKAVWASKTVTGLVSGTSYSFTVIARNTNGTPDQSAYGSAASGTPNPTLPSTITSCGGCHGYTGTANPLTDVAGRNPVPTQGRFSGSHAVHTTQYSYACAKCHVNDAAYTNTHRNSLIEMASPINGDTGGVYVKGASWTQTNSPSAYTACNGVYCHSQGSKLTSPYTGTNISPTTNLVWSSNRGTCASCHGNPPGYANVSPKANSHAEHITFPCNACHNRTTTDGSTITSVARHANKFYNISANGLRIGFGAYTARAKFTYAYVATFGGTAPNDGASTCSVIYCHNGKNAKWGGSTTDTSLAVGVILKCVDCHDKKIYRNKGRPNTILGDAVSEFGLAWGHKKTGRGAVTDADCIVCHLEGVYATQKTSPTFHADGNIDLRDPAYVGAGEVAITNISGGVFKFQRFSTSYAAGSRTSTGHTSNTDIANVVTQKFCLGCHRAGGATNTTARTPVGGTANMPFGGINLGATNYTVANGAVAVGGLVNVNSQLLMSNSSKHPVLGPLNRDYATADRLNVPYKPTGTRGIDGTLSNGVVMNCFDCHNVVGTPFTLRTVSAHGNGVTIRGVATTSGQPASLQTTFCVVCHAGYNNFATNGSSHGAGSAFSTDVNQAPMDAYLNYACNMCHGSNYATAVVRPVRAQDVHGVNVLPAGGVAKSDRWAGTSVGTPAQVNARPYAFMRNTDVLSNHTPKKIGGTTYTPNCNMAAGTCTQGPEPYTVGGTF